MRKRIVLTIGVVCLLTACSREVVQPVQPVTQVPSVTKKVIPNKIEFKDEVNTGVKPKFEPSFFSSDISSDPLTEVNNVRKSLPRTREDPYYTSSISEDALAFSTGLVKGNTPKMENSNVGKEVQSVESPYRPAENGDTPLNRELYSRMKQIAAGDNLDPINIEVAKQEQPAFDKLKALGIYRATAYDLSFQSCGKHLDDPGYGITASGVSLKGKTREQAMSVAVDPKVVPLGSKLYVKFEGKYASFSGVYTAVDTGSAVNDNHIDVFIGDFNSEEPVQLAYDFGNQHPQVYQILD